MNRGHLPDSDTDILCELGTALCDELAELSATSQTLQAESRAAQDRAQRMRADCKRLLRTLAERTDARFHT